MAANQQLQLGFDRPTAIWSVEELYTKADQALLNKLTEDSRFERKPAGIHPDALGEYFSMFANTKPDGGLIAVGIENDGTMSGCVRSGQEKVNRLEQAGDTYAPDARYESRRAPVIRGDGQADFVVLFRVHYRKDKVVETVRGDAFWRRGDSKRKLTDEQKRELQLDKGQLDLESEPCDRLAFPHDFDAELISQFAERFRSSRDLTKETTDEEVLELRHLGTIESRMFRPNVACALLFGRDPARVVPGCKIRFLRFEGEQEGSGERFNPVKDVWLEGNVPALIVGAERVLESQLREFSRLGPDGHFYTAPEYPKLAWYEAVVNACVHRSYGMRNMVIFVKMFDDRLVVESPGGFPGLVTPQNIYDMSYPRNPYLMDAMYYLQFVRAAHEGTRRIRDSMAELSLPPPEFEQKEVGHALVRVTLRNNIKQRKVWIDADATSVVGEAIYASLSEPERRTINFVAEHGAVNVSQVQRLTGMSWPTSRKLLMQMAARGILEHVARTDIDRDPRAHFVLKGKRPSLGNRG
ncbi:MAG: hypothetical protein FJ290_18915 [Planctomycetes bacterium]|nr:hypothetical protein [Planctomycetota bacterium]